MFRFRLTAIFLTLLLSSACSTSFSLAPVSRVDLGSNTLVISEKEEERMHFAQKHLLRARAYLKNPTCDSSQAVYDSLSAISLYSDVGKSVAMRNTPAYGSFVETERRYWRAVGISEEELYGLLGNVGAASGKLLLTHMKNSKECGDPFLTVRERIYFVSARVLASEKRVRDCEVLLCEREEINTIHRNLLRSWGADDGDIEFILGDA